MKKGLATKKLISSIVITVLLLYFMIKNEGAKLIFIPFLICSVSSAGKSFSQILNNQNGIRIFHRLFVLGFALFWVGFLVAACFICIRDKNYQMLLFTIPFWIGGFFMIKNKLMKKTNKNVDSPMVFAFVMSGILVALALIAGIVILIMGIKQQNSGLMIAGAFFLFGALVFILTAIRIIKGLRDRNEI